VIVNAEDVEWFSAEGVSDSERRRRSPISAQGWSAATTLGVWSKWLWTLKGLTSHMP